MILAIFGGFVFLSGAAVYLFFVKFRQHRMQSFRGLRLITGNFLILILLLSIFLIGAECYFRFFCDASDSFAVSRISRRWLERHFVLNRQGFRDDQDYQYRRSAEKRRVTFLGDSFTAAQGVSDVRNRFANIVREKRPSWEIHTFAALGRDTPHQLEFIRRIRPSYDFDLLVLAYCLNDIAPYAPIAARQKWLRMLDDVNNTNYFTEHSYFLNLLHARRVAALHSDIGNYWQSTSQLFTGETWQRHQSDLRQLKQEIENAGGRLCVVTFPLFHLLDAYDEYQPCHDELRGFWSSLDVPHLDLTSIYEGMPAAKLVVSPSDAHPNELAHAMAAEAILHFLDGAMQQRSSE
jgi:hypothetical protein